MNFESMVIWLVLVLIILIIFIPYVLKFRRRSQVDKQRKDEAVMLGADIPVAQYPQIDYHRCIGCGACVEACPEGGVLGVVQGKATIINGLKCVGHGLCAEACPVSGIKIGLGDIKGRDDIPVLNDRNETNLPGLYIAGELAGLALIKNAIVQGQMVIEDIAGRIVQKNSNGKKDIVIVGAGPAGMSAALTAQRHQLNYLLIDQQESGGTIRQYPRKKIVMTRPVEMPLFGVLNKSEYSKEELLAIWETIHKKFNINFKSGEKLEMIQKRDKGFTIATQNSSYESDFVVLALGRRGTPRKLNVPGEDAAKVMYKLMDAESYQNEHLLVVGGGDSAIEAAIGLAKQKGNTVTLSYRKSSFFRIKSKNEEKITKLIAEKKVTVLFNTTISEIKETEVRIKTDKNEQLVLANSFVFVFAGGEPPFPLMQKIGIQFGGTIKD
jgi:putative YpdA family bacillithiol system oxidoreductase